MNKNIITSIYLIGPGKSKMGLDPTVLQDKVVFNFSGDLVWFNDNNLYPKYWTFLDPNSTTYIFSRLHGGRYNTKWFEGLKQNTHLLYHDCQGTDSFYKHGFTTSRGMGWNREEFGGKLLPQLKTFFKTTQITPTLVTVDSFDTLLTNQYPMPSPIVTHGKHINSDKFSCFTLPLVISYFPSLKNIYCVGFGDFEEPRLYNNSSAGYEGYIKSYERIKHKLKEVLQHKGINIKFHNINSYYKELEWKK